MIVAKGYDVMGNVCVVKFGRGVKSCEKKKWGERFVREHRSVRTIVEKIGKFSGRLRTNKTKYVFGEKTKEVLYKENGCVFRFNVDTCYFSPRLSSERKEIASFVRKGEKVLVMFGGVAPFGIVIAKNSGAGKVVSVEFGCECNKYAVENVKRNKVLNVVSIMQGNVNNLKLVKNDFGIMRGGKFNKLVDIGQKGFDRIVMARPNLKDSFLDVAFSVAKKNGIIHYYGFYEENKAEEMKKMIVDEARKARRKIRILKIKKAGEIGVKKFRYRGDIRVLG